MNPNPSTHGDMGWGSASRECYPKAMTRSYQGQISLKFVKIVYFSGLAPILLTWDVYGGWNSLNLQHGNIPKHPTRSQGWYNGTNGFPIPENLGVEALFVIIWWQVTEIWHIFTFRWLTWPMTLTHGVTLNLNYENNVTNAFPVSENLGVEPLVVFIWWLITEIFHFLHWSCGRHFEYAN